jgi:hypothetical protein
VPTLGFCKRIPELTTIHDRVLESLKAVESVVDLCNLGEGFFGEHNRLVLGIGECLGRSVEHQVRSIISLKVLAAIARSYKLLRSIYRRWRIEPN